MNRQSRGLFATAALAAVSAVFPIGCDGDSSGNGEAASANLPDVQMHVVAASSGDASAWVLQKESSEITGPLELEPGRSFWVSADGSPGDSAGEPVRLMSDLRAQEVAGALFQIVFYQDAFPIFAAKLDQAGKDRYYIVYNEDGREEGASYATIPQPFQITAPLPNEIVSLPNDLVVQWDTNDTVDEVLLHAAVFCEDEETIEEDWYSISLGSDVSGTHTIPGSSISQSIADTCPLRIEVARGREGIPGPEFAGSDVVGYRTSTVTLTATN